MIQQCFKASVKGLDQGLSYQKKSYPETISGHLVFTEIVRKSKQRYQIPWLHTHTHKDNQKLRSYSISHGVLKSTLQLR